MSANPDGASNTLPSAASTFLGNLKETFKQGGEDSDLTITCSEHEWHVHKLILCLHSDVFKKMLRGQFKESAQEQVALEDDDTDVLDVLFEWMYTFEYRGNVRRLFDTSTLVLDMRVAKAADFYNMPDLERIAFQAFKKHTSSILVNVDVVEAISEAFMEDGYDKFRQLLLEVAIKNLEAVKAEPAKYDHFWKVVESCGPFAVALLQAPNKKSTANADLIISRPLSKDAVLAGLPYAVTSMRNRPIPPPPRVQTASSVPGPEMVSRSESGPEDDLILPPPTKLETLAKRKLSISNQNSGLQPKRFKR